MNRRADEGNGSKQVVVERRRYRQRSVEVASSRPWWPCEDRILDSSQFPGSLRYGFVFYLFLQYSYKKYQGRAWFA
jgi:hypothetical protein